MKTYNVTFATEKNPSNFLTFKVKASSMFEALKKIEERYAFNNTIKAEEIKVFILNNQKQNNEKVNQLH